MLIQAALWKPSEYSVEEYNKYVVSLMLPAQKERSVPFVVSTRCLGLSKIRTSP